MTSPDPFTAAALPWTVTMLERYADGGWKTAPGPVLLRTPVRS